MGCENNDNCVAGWALFSFVAVALAATWVVLARVFKKWRALKREVEKGKKVDLNISNPINTQRCFTPWENRVTLENRREGTHQPLTTGASHTVGGGRSGGGRGGDEEGQRDLRGGTENGTLEVSESGSYIRSSQVGRGPRVQPRTAGGEGGGGGAGRRDEAVDYQVREASGSIVSERSDYVDNSDGWVSRGQDGQPRTVIIPLTRQPVPGGGGEWEMVVRGDPEDYVHMKSISSANRYLGVVQRDYRGLAQVPEEDVDPTDYEHPVSNEREGEMSQVEEGRQDHHRPRVAYKGGALPSLSSAVAMPGTPGGATGGGVVQVKRYMNVEVKEFDPSMDMFCSSEHHKDTSQDSNNPPPPVATATTVAKGEEEDDRDKAQKKHHDYINIDGEKLPPENPPIPKNSH